MVLFDAGAAVPADRPGLDGGQARGRGGGGPRGRDPPQQTRVQTPPQTLQVQERTHHHVKASTFLFPFETI